MNSKPVVLSVPRQFKRLFLLAAAGLTLTSCETATQDGALLGGLGGAAIGGIAGGRKGALIGGAVGALGGAAVGNSRERRGY
jgi:hypothetical protein